MDLDNLGFDESLSVRNAIALPDQYANVLRRVQAIADRARSNAPGLRQYLGELESYCMFSGYPYSGHSLFGALLDAHREIAVSHELNALFWIDWVRNREELFYLILQHTHLFSKQESKWNDYHYSVAGQHQGSFDTLRVIGDKKGGMSAQMLGKNPGLLDKLRQLVGLPVKLIHVIRNPYDNIATMSRRDNMSLSAAAARYFWLARVNEAIERRSDVETYRIFYEDFLKAPEEWLAKTVAFLGRKAESEYLAACAGIVFEKPTLPRNKVEWDPATVRFVEAEKSKIGFLRDYGFDC